MNVNTATNRITTLLTEQKAKQTMTVDEIRLQINATIDEYADSKFKILNLQNVNNRFNWNHFFIGYGVGLLLAFIIWLTVF